jgi:hypothetical protein
MRPKVLEKPTTFWGWSWSSRPTGPGLDPKITTESQKGKVQIVLNLSLAN